MRRAVIAIAAAATAAVLLYVLFQTPNDRGGDRINVAIASLVEIVPIAQLREGFKQRLSEVAADGKYRFSFSEFNAQGDSATMTQIVDTLSIRKPDAVYVLGTPFAQALRGRIPDLLVIQGAATDPVAAGLAASWSGSKTKYIASSDLPPAERLLDICVALRPQGKAVGVIYNTGEVNSVAVVQRLREAVSKTGWRLEEVSISGVTDVATAIQSLATRSDVVILPPDNTAVAAAPAIGRALEAARIPLVATTRDSLDSGAVAALAVDFVDLGREAADLYVKVLDGADPGSLPITFSKNPKLYVSKSRAVGLGVDVDSFSKTMAAEIVQ